MCYGNEMIECPKRKGVSVVIGHGGQWGIDWDMKENEMGRWMGKKRFPAEGSAYIKSHKPESLRILRTESIFSNFKVKVDFEKYTKSPRKDSEKVDS